MEVFVWLNTRFFFFFFCTFLKKARSRASLRVDRLAVSRSGSRPAVPPRRRPPPTPPVRPPVPRAARRGGRGAVRVRRARAVRPCGVPRATRGVRKTAPPWYTITW